MSGWNRPEEISAKVSFWVGNTRVGAVRGELSGGNCPVEIVRGGIYLKPLNTALINKSFGLEHS